MRSIASGKYAALFSAPGGGAKRPPGLQVHRHLPAVAGTDAQHRLRVIMPHCTLLPGAAPGACPG
ncbi:hypothetical protein, partial [Klebsiella oxytoca]|uniref:hypothetical protein n=1 Tax=Klebsiella oxytoca TaxID=571 RepID=UPI00271D4447